MKRCPNCGAENNDAQSFCVNCGVQFADPTAETTILSDFGSGATTISYTQTQNVYQQPNMQPSQPNAYPQQNTYVQPQPNAYPQQGAYAQPAANGAQPYQYGQQGQNAYPNGNVAPNGVNNQKAPSMGWFKFVTNFALFAGAVLNLIGGGSSIINGLALLIETGNSIAIVNILYGVIAIGFAVFGIIVRFKLAAFKKGSVTMLYALLISSLVIGTLYSILVRIINPNVDSISSVIVSTPVSIAMLIINIVYFNKIKYMFCK